jgi:hypothetical protein
VAVKFVKHFEEVILWMYKGIILHRAIDTLPMRIHFRQSTKKLHAKYHIIIGRDCRRALRPFSGNWTKYSDERENWSLWDIYQSLYDNNEILSEQTKTVLPLDERNWLVSYQTIRRD